MTMLTFHCTHLIARNFLMLGVPPTDRSPLIIDLGDDAVETVSTNIGLYNVMLANFASVFASVYPGASLVLFDTQPVFNTVSGVRRAWRGVTC